MTTIIITLGVIAAAYISINLYMRKKDKEPLYSEEIYKLHEQERERKESVRNFANKVFEKINAGEKDMEMDYMDFYYYWLNNMRHPANEMADMSKIQYFIFPGTDFKIWRKMETHVTIKLPGGYCRSSTKERIEADAKAYAEKHMVDYEIDWLHQEVTFFAKNESSHMSYSYRNIKHQMPFHFLSELIENEK